MDEHQRPPGRPFAPGPLTPWAEAMADLALAAVEERELPPLPLPAIGTLAPPYVEWAERVGPPPTELEVLAVAFEVELILKRGEPVEDAEGAARWGSVELTLAVGRNGIRLVGLRPRRLERAPLGGVAPAGLEGLTEVVTLLVADLRRADISRWELGDADRALLDNDSVWAQVEEDRPRSLHVRELATLLAELPEAPLALALDDVGVLVRTEDERLLSLSFDLDADATSFALSTDPLLRVGQLWPR